MEIFDLRNIQEDISINTSTLSFYPEDSCRDFDFNVDATLKVFKKENNEVVFTKTKENFSVKKINEFIKSGESETINFSTQGFGVYRAEITITGRDNESCFRRVIFTDFELKKHVYKNPVFTFQIGSNTFDTEQENDSILFVEKNCITCSKQHSMYFYLNNTESDIDPDSDIHTRTYSVYPIIDGVEKKDLAQLIHINSYVNIDFTDSNYNLLVEEGVEHTLKFKIDDINTESKNIIIRKINQNIRVDVSYRKEGNDIILNVNSLERNVDYCMYSVYLTGNTDIYKKENGDWSLFKSQLYAYSVVLYYMDNRDVIVYKIVEDEFEDGDYKVVFSGTLTNNNYNCTQAITNDFPFTISKQAPASYNLILEQSIGGKNKNWSSTETGDIRLCYMCQDDRKTFNELLRIKTSINYQVGQKLVDEYHSDTIPSIFSIINGVEVPYGVPIRNKKFFGEAPTQDKQEEFIYSLDDRFVGAEQLVQNQENTLKVKLKYTDHEIISNEIKFFFKYKILELKDRVTLTIEEKRFI